MQPQEAIPVGRFSTPEQEQGDSERRQAISFRRVCERRGLTPSTRWAIFDKGLSGYHGEHLTRGELGRFLAEAEAGHVRPDRHGRMPVLVLEAVDRLTRLPQLEATDLIKRLVNLGMTIVFDEADLLIDKHTIEDQWIILQVLVDQAYQFSKRLARRKKSSWEAKRESDHPTRHSCPRWLRWDAREQHYVVIEEQADVVRAMFRWCAEGVSLRQIMDKLPAGWSLSQVAGLLGTFMGRAVLGEWQPCDGRKRPIGEPRPQEYPAILTEAEFYAAQNALASRRRAAGPRGKDICNLFKGLMFDLDGQPCWIQGDGPKWCRRVVRPKGSYLHRRGARSVPYVWVEKCVLHLVSELRAQDLLPKVTTAGRVETIKAKLGVNQTKLEKVAARLLTADVTEAEALLDNQKALRQQRRELQAELEQAAAEAHVNRVAALEETQSCLEALLTATDQEATRIRLAGLVRRVIARIIVIPSEDRGDFSALLLVVLSGGQTWYEIDLPDLREDPALEGVTYRVIDLLGNGYYRERMPKVATA